MLSNIGSDTWKDFGTKFESITGLFDGFYTPHKDNKYIGKPSEEFYRGFRKYLDSNDCEGKQILFVDDMEKNIIGAVAAGIAGIHFRSHEDLCNILTLLKVKVIKEEEKVVKSEENASE